MHTHSRLGILGLSLAGAATACGGCSGESMNPIASAAASVAVTPAATTLRTGGSQQFTAQVRDGAGAIVEGAPVTWRSLDGAIAGVGASGMAAAISVGEARVVASVGDFADTAIVTVTAAPPPPSGSVDPTLLPSAVAQRPVAGSYGRTLAAGQTYVDPNSQVTVLKLTSATVPAANGGMYHGYSEGGPNISLPWTGTDGQTYYTLKVADWLVDLRYATLTPTNWRPLDADGEIGLAFSMNPLTPRIAYVINGRQVNRYNTATNRIENTGSWPWVITTAGEYPGWLQTQVNDTWLVAMHNSNYTLLAFRPADGAQRSVTRAAAGVVTDEPHLDREHPVVYITGDAPPEQKIWNLADGSFTIPRDPAGINEDSHTATLRGKALAVSWRGDAIVETDWQGNVRRAVTPSPTDWSGDYHLAGQWVFGNPQEYIAVDQWEDDGASYVIRRGMIGLASVATGDVRLLVAHDGVGTGYNTGGQVHPTLAPDGRLLMWVTNMNGSGRYDTFVARIPTR
jgi:hypothetical protein